MLTIGLVFTYSQTCQATYWYNSMRELLLLYKSLPYSDDHFWKLYFTYPKYTQAREQSFHQL